MTLFHGLSAFPPTPTDDAGTLDADAMRGLLLRLAEAEVDSIGLLGSTGGYAFLRREQRRRAVEVAVECVRGRTPIMVGVGALRTDDAQSLARDAKAAGADGLLLAPVSYTPLTDAEVYLHFTAVSEAGRLPLCIYNNPSTTKFTFCDDLIARLAQVPNIVAIKMPIPTNGDCASELARLRARTPQGFSIGYSSDWGAGNALLAGCDCWYSVVAGLMPKPALMLTKAARAGDSDAVARIDSQFRPLWDEFEEFGSFRVMYAIADLLGLAKAEPPRPVLPIPQDARGRVDRALEQLCVVQ
ncbi:MAG: dihydrodipicolinate synthase family protein [Rhizobiaceae bacterium]|nr:dihydrodipicolinate synthase family protein [Rhizobiaceae bacterium]